MPLIKEIIAVIESFAPPAFQEDYDNAALLTGNLKTDCEAVLLTLDCTEEVIEEAIQKNCNLIIAHHPVIFKGLKKLTGSNYVERTIIKAIQSGIAVYACHTNLDNVQLGVNHKIAQKLGLMNTQVLAPKTGLLRRLETYVPAGYEDKVREALFNAGAGNVGNYDQCSFNLEGTGTFRGNEHTHPFLGESGKLSREKETKIECIFEAYKMNQVLNALFEAHPYEEVAYAVFHPQNHHRQVGSGLIGHFEEGMSEQAFLNHLKVVFGLKVLKHTSLTGKKIQKVALCGGSGQFLLKNAISSKADAYVSADFKYHEYFDAEGKLLLADIGHFESEQFTPEIFYEIIQKKFPKFAIHLSKTNTNPVNYF
jgi:dinuclear metal center YbgI/SA1388 family protein